MRYEVTLNDGAKFMVGIYPIGDPEKTMVRIPKEWFDYRNAKIYHKQYRMLNKYRGEPYKTPEDDPRAIYLILTNAYADMLFESVKKIHEPKQKKENNMKKYIYYLTPNEDNPTATVPVNYEYDQERDGGRFTCDLSDNELRDYVLTFAGATVQRDNNDEAYVETTEGELIKAIGRERFDAGQVARTQITLIEEA